MRERELFIEALQKENAAERDAFLDEACARDDDLRQRVERLLEEHQRQESFILDLPPSGMALTSLHAIIEAPGTQIGPYKLLEQIGEGGFGVVFMAEQQEPMRRRVALKVIKPGMDTRQVIARFEAERQALAVMEHPNIAKVLDAGTTTSGRPFFVMELVKGLPITDYCDRAHLTSRQRLELFVGVCQAVQHAHQKGIIHRDLKPSNVLVTEPDGQPAVKVIDFGVAKATGGQLTDKTLFTGFAQMIGTPLYMSPEQAGLSVDIDTRSDIYSLGVLLYELLAGTTPFDRRRFQEAAYDEVRRIIREEDPPKPSTRLSESKDTLPSIAANRQTEPARLTKEVRGELDWIVMKCLEKDRNRRYETANGLVADIERYLDDEPVQACPPSAAYRFRKFARRNRVALTTATVVLVTIVMGLAASAVLIARERDAAQAAADRARVAAQDAERERERAETNFRKAREAVDRVFTVAAEKMTDQPHMEQIRRELLEDALEFYQGFLEQKGTDPGVRYETARAYFRVGRIKFFLGRLDQTAAPFEEAVALLQRLSTEYPAVPEYRRDLAFCYSQLSRLWSEVYHAQPEKSLHYVLEALAIQRKLAADFPNKPHHQLEFAWTLNNTGLRYKGCLNDYGQSEKYFREALRCFEQMQKNSPDDPNVLEGIAHTHHWLGALLLDMNRLPEAEAEFRQGLIMREQLLAERPDDRDLRSKTAHNKAYLAGVLQRTRRFVEAEPLIRDAVALREDVLDDFPNSYEDWRRLRLEYEQWGNLLLAMERMEEAELTLRRRPIVLKKLIELNPSNWETWSSRGENYAELGEWDKAVDDLTQASKLTTPAEQPQVWCDLALLRLATHDDAAYRHTCATLVEQSLQAKVPSGDQAFRIAWTCVLLLQDGVDPAQVVRIAEGAVAANSQDPDYLIALGAALYRAARFNDAAKTLADAHAAYQHEAAAPTPGIFVGTTVTYCHLFLAMTHERLNQHDQAVTLLKEAVEAIDHPPDAQRPPDRAWKRRLTLQRLRREAEELINGKQDSSPESQPQTEPEKSD